MLARQNVNGLHVWDKRRALPQDSARDWRDGRDEVGIQIYPRRALLACLALHAPRSVALADFFSILLANRT
jgi:hypothetical protein